MEWVETTGRTVAEALDAALDQLGVDEADAEFEVLDEPRSGLFGRVRTEARVRARVLPTKPRAKEDRRIRRKPSAGSEATTDRETIARPAGEAAVTAEAPPAKARVNKVASSKVASGRPSRPSASDAPAAAAPPASGRSRRPSAAVLPSSGDDEAVFAPKSPEEESVMEVASEFLDGLLEQFGVESNLRWSRVNAETLQVEVQGQDLGMLIGPKAQTLYAVQDLLRTVVHYEVGDRQGRLLLDVAGYREKRRVALEGFARKLAAEVLASGERRALEPMVASDRKVVHDTCNIIEGVSTVSEGEDPARHVVILPG